MDIIRELQKKKLWKWKYISGCKNVYEACFQRGKRGCSQPGQGKRDCQTSTD